MVEHSEIINIIFKDYIEGRGFAELESRLNKIDKMFAQFMETSKQSKVVGKNFDDIAMSAKEAGPAMRETERTIRFMGRQAIVTTKRWKKTGDTWEKTSEDMTKSTRPFRMEMLSVMFGAMQLQRTFSGLLDPLRDAAGLQDYWNAIMIEQTVDAIEPTIDALEFAGEAMQYVNNMTGDSLGKMLLFGEATSGTLAAISQATLFFDGLSSTLGGLAGGLGTLGGATAAAGGGIGLAVGALTEVAKIIGAIAIPIFLFDENNLKAGKTLLGGINEIITKVPGGTNKSALAINSLGWAVQGLGTIFSDTGGDIEDDLMVVIEKLDKIKEDIKAIPGVKIDVETPVTDKAIAALGKLALKAKIDNIIISAELTGDLDTIRKCEDLKAKVDAIPDADILADLRNDIPTKSKLGEVKAAVDAIPSSATTKVDMTKTEGYKTILDEIKKDIEELEKKKVAIPVKLDLVIGPLLPDIAKKLTDVALTLARLPVYAEAKLALDLVKTLSKLFGLTIPGIQKGGIITRPTLAMIGEAGPEAVVPLDKGMAGTVIHSPTFHISTVLGPENMDIVARQLAEKYAFELSRVSMR